MAMQIVTMFDTIGTDAGNIPPGAVKVAGYVTGTPDIMWNASAWARFDRAGRVRVDQSPAGGAYALHMANGKPAIDADVYDMELRAGTADRFAELAPQRHAAGAGNCGYGTPTTRAAAAAALDAMPGLEWRGSFGWWLADPNLNEAEADALIGQVIDGFYTVAVQWATPTTNPDTPVPGSTSGATLKSANLDLNRALAAWHPAPAPPAVPWQHSALQMARQLETLGTALVTLLEAHQ